MPWNYFEIQLGDGFFIVADFTRVDGIVVSFVVRLMYEVDPENRTSG